MKVPNGEFYGYVYDQPFPPLYLAFIGLKFVVVPYHQLFYHSEHKTHDTQPLYLFRQGPLRRY